MIRRLLAGLGSLLLLAAGLLGLPAFLLAAHRALADQLPALGDVPAALLAPGDGGLFLLLLFAVGAVCWAVFAVAFVVEVLARVRGISTPRLGAFFPQATMARAVSAVALLLTLTTPAAAAGPVAAGPAAPMVTAAASSTPATAVTETPEEPSAEADGYRAYTVARGDTLWDIADEQLDDPYRWPQIAKASDQIAQPGGRQLEDPDLILPGWTLHIPDAAEPLIEDAEPLPTPPTADEPPAAPPTEHVVPPQTPMQSTTPDDQSTGPAAAAPATPMAGPPAGGSAAGGGRTSAGSAARARARVLPTTPLSGPAEQAATPPAPVQRVAVYDDEGRAEPVHGVLGLPNWITTPLTPTPAEDAPELVAAAQRHLAAGGPAPDDTGRR